MKELHDKDLGRLVALTPFYCDDTDNAHGMRIARAAIAADRALNAPADRDVMRQANEDCVTRESALMAIEYVALSNIGSREFEAKRMLVTALSQAHVTVLPDGSAFSTGSFPLPESHWLYAPRCSEWDGVRDTTADTPHPILTHEARDSVVAAVRYAVRGATMCGAEKDFDPDAIVQNAVYALCGPYGNCTTAATPAPPAEQQGEQEPVAWWNGFRRSDPDECVYKSLSEIEDLQHDIPLYAGTNPVTILATLRAEVEGLKIHSDGITDYARVDDVLALIDKMGGGV